MLLALLIVAAIDFGNVFIKLADYFMDKTNQNTTVFDKIDQEKKDDLTAKIEALNSANQSKIEFSKSSQPKDSSTSDKSKSDNPINIIPTVNFTLPTNANSKIPQGYLNSFNSAISEHISQFANEINNTVSMACGYSGNENQSTEEIKDDRVVTVNGKQYVAPNIDYADTLRRLLKEGYFGFEVESDGRTVIVDLVVVLFYMLSADEGEVKRCSGLRKFVEESKFSLVLKHVFDNEIGRLTDRIGIKGIDDLLKYIREELIDDDKYKKQFDDHSGKALNGLKYLSLFEKIFDSVDGKSVDSMQRAIPQEFCDFFENKLNLKMFEVEGVKDFKIVSEQEFAKNVGMLYWSILTILNANLNDEDFSSLKQFKDNVEKAKGFKFKASEKENLLIGNKSIWGVAANIGVGFGKLFYKIPETTGRVLTIDGSQIADMLKSLLRCCIDRNFIKTGDEETVICSEKLLEYKDVNGRIIQRDVGDKGKGIYEYLKKFREKLKIDQERLCHQEKERKQQKEKLELATQNQESAQKFPEGVMRKIASLPSDEQTSLLTASVQNNQSAWSGFVEERVKFFSEIAADNNFNLDIHKAETFKKMVHDSSGVLNEEGKVVLNTLITECYTASDVIALESCLLKFDDLINDVRKRDVNAPIKQEQDHNNHTPINSEQKKEDFNFKPVNSDPYKNPLTKPQDGQNPPTKQQETDSPKSSTQDPTSTQSTKIEAGKFKEEVKLLRKKLDTILSSKKNKDVFEKNGKLYNYGKIEDDEISAGDNGITVDEYCKIATWDLAEKLSILREEFNYDKLLDEICKFLKTTCVKEYEKEINGFRNCKKNDFRQNFATYVKRIVVKTSNSLVYRRTLLPDILRSEKLSNIIYAELHATH